MIDVSAPAPWRWFNFLAASRRADEELARANPFLAAALAEEKREGQRLATWARIVAMAAIALLLPFLGLSYGTLYYESFTLAFVAIGLLQLRYARVGQSRMELALILLDIGLLTFILVWPNPFVPEAVPGAFPFRFGNFVYFFVILAVATLAYSWRTVWTMGAAIALAWLCASAAISVFGLEIPALGEAARAAFAGHPVIAASMDPNDLQFPIRLQEAVVFLIVAGVLALRGWRVNRLLMQQAEIAAERANLSRYFPPNLVDLLAARREGVGAERAQNVAVLFADIVGFTALAERLPPARVMALLRGYHATIENAIFSHGGTLDKFLGDGVMATFGTPQTGPHDASNAFAAARSIVEGVDAWARQMAAKGEPELRVSVGVHYGPAIVGNIGPARRLEFAVLGDAVNVAARLEAATRDLRCRIAVSGDLVARMRQEGGGKPRGFALRRAYRLRGRASAVDLWTGPGGRGVQAGRTARR
jgi:adenylate cyclase